MAYFIDGNTVTKKFFIKSSVNRLLKYFWQVLNDSPLIEKFTLLLVNIKFLKCKGYFGYRKFESVIKNGVYINGNMRQKFRR